MTDSTSDDPNRIGSMSTKRLIYIHRSGPAFDPNEISKSHTELDLAGVPVTGPDGRTYSLRERIAYLRGWKDQLSKLFDALVGDRQ